MNNTFSFKRFIKLLGKDNNMYLRNFGTSIIVFSCMPAVFWIFNLIFSTTTHPGVRLAFICIMVAIAMMIVPSKVYGNANLSREGVGFAMLPASSLEKFLCMFIHCAILTPIIIFCWAHVVDLLLSLFPFGGFEERIHILTISEIVRMLDDSDGVVQVANSGIVFSDIFPVGVIRTAYYTSIIQWAAIFMLGNMLFKKHKAGKTFACYLGISYVVSTIFGLLVFSSERVKLWFERFDEFSDAQIASTFVNCMTWSLVISIIITVLLLFFTYRKIKTQKY